MRKLSLTLLILCALVRPELAQTQPQTPQQPSQPVNEVQDDVVKITTNLVQVDAVVLKDGKVVKNLTKEDFEIFEDGKRQEISTFAFISNTAGGGPIDARVNNKTPEGLVIPTQPIQPNEARRTIALVVDDVGLTGESIGRVRQKLTTFINEQIAANDLVAVIRTGGTMGALQQFTNDKRVLTQAVNQITYNHCSRVGINTFSPQGGALCSRSAYQQTMGALRYVVDAMGYLPGRKSMVVFSDSLPMEEQEVDFANIGERDTALGRNPMSDEVDKTKVFNQRDSYASSLFKIAEKAIRSSVVIYTVDVKGLVPTALTAADSPQFNSMGGMDYQTRMNALNRARSTQLTQQREGAELIARQTGGFLVRNSNSMDLDRIIEDQSGYYLIGYRPSNETFDKSFHKIKARVKRSGMTLRTRFGFFGVSEEETSKSKPVVADKMSLALISPFATADLSLDLTAFFTHNPGGGSTIRAIINMNPKDLVFKETTGGNKEASVEFRIVIFGDNGQIVDRKTVGKTFSIPAAEFDEKMRSSATTIMEIPVKRPGSYQFRVAVRDVESSKIGASGQFISIPNIGNGRLAISGIVLQGPATATAVNTIAKVFTAGSAQQFALGIYNAASDPAKGQPNVSLQARLFSDEKVVYTSPIMVVDAKNQPDPSHLIAIGTLQLSAGLVPGPYALQIIVTDNNAKEKTAIMQWVNFEVVK